MTSGVVRAAGVDVIASATPPALYERTNGVDVVRRHEVPIQYIRAAGLDAICNHVVPIQYIWAAGVDVIYGEAPNERFGPGSLTSLASTVHGTGLRGAEPRVGSGALSSPVSRLSAYGLTGQVIVQATYSHAAGQIAAIGALTMRDLGNAPTVVEVTYTNTTTTPWSQATATASLPGVGTTRPRRVSSVSLLGIQRHSQAMREAVERLNKLNLGNLTTTIDVFDEGIRHDIGDLIAVDFPALGLVNKAFRVTSAPQMSKVGRWRLDLAEHDPAAYSNLVQTADSTPDTVRVIQTADPSDVQMLTASAAQGNVTVSWALPPDVLYSRTSIKVGGTDWTTGTEIFSGRATITTFPVTAEGVYVLRAKHILSDGRESTNVASFTLNVTADDLVRGANGSDGANAVWPILSTPALIFPATVAGNVSSYANASVSMTIMQGSAGGSIDDTANWTLTYTTSAGIGVSRAGNTFTVTTFAAAQDTGLLTITATRAGYQPLVQSVSLSKSKTGNPGTAGTQGTRGSVETYRNTTGSTWSDADAVAALVALGIDTGPVRGDRVTLQNTSLGYVEARYFNGAGWVAWQARVDGNLLVTGSVGAAALNADEVFSLRLNIADKFIVGSDGIARFKNAEDRMLNLGATGQEYVLQVEDVLGIQADGDSYFSGRLLGATGEFSGTLSAGVLDASAFDGIVMPAYATPGTFTLTAPAKKEGWSRMDIRVTIVGGGGGGGGGHATTAPNDDAVSSGAGGGGAERRTFIVQDIADGESFTVVVGAPGLGGAGNTAEFGVAGNGGNGGRSSVTRALTMTEIASAAAGTGGQGGRIDYIAQPGSSGGVAGTKGRDSTGKDNATGGAGGSSYYMAGGLGGANGAAGRDGSYGSGGGGGGSSTRNSAIGGSGGNGGNGWIEITFFSGSLLTPADRHNALVDWCETFGFGTAPTGVRV